MTALSLKLHRQKKVLFPCFFILVYCIFSCTSGEQQNQYPIIVRTNSNIRTFQDSDFTDRTAKFEYCGISLGKDVINIAIKDSLLFASQRSGDSAIAVYSLKSKRKIVEIISRGANGASILQPTSIFFGQSDNLFIFDNTLKKVIEVKLKNIQNGGNYIRSVTKLDQIPLAVYNLQMWNDCLFVATTFSKLHATHRAILLSQSNGKFKKGFGSLPILREPLPLQGEKAVISMDLQLLNCKFTKMENRTAFFYSQINMIDVYQDEKLIRRSSGENRNSYVKIARIKKTDGDVFSPVNFEKTSFYFSSVCSNEDYIIGAISGRNSFLSCGNRLLVFDWNGRPKMQINLPFESCSIAYGKINYNKYIYCVNSNSGELFQCKL